MTLQLLFQSKLAEESSTSVENTSEHVIDVNDNNEQAVVEANKIDNF